MKCSLLLIALVAVSISAYDFTKPDTGSELQATLKDERDQTFIIFFKAGAYEGDDENSKTASKAAKDMKDDVTKACNKYGLKEKHNLILLGFQQ